MKKCKQYMGVIGRILMGAFFVLAGIMKLMNPEGYAQAMAEAGLPLAGILVWFVIVFLIVSGGSLMAGRMTCLVGTLLAVYVLIVSILYHIGDASGFLKNIAIIGGLLAIASSCDDDNCQSGVCGIKKKDDHEHKNHNN